MTDIEFKAKLQSIRFGTPRKPKVEVVNDVKNVEAIHEETGGTAGYHSHHGDGHVDATAHIQTVRASGKAKEPN